MGAVRPINKKLYNLGLTSIDDLRTISVVQLQMGWRRGRRTCWSWWHRHSWTKSIWIIGRYKCTPLLLRVRAYVATEPTHLSLDDLRTTSVVQLQMNWRTGRRTCWSWWHRHSWAKSIWVVGSYKYTPLLLRVRAYVATEPTHLNHNPTSTWKDFELDGATESSCFSCIMQAVLKTAAPFDPIMAAMPA